MISTVDLDGYLTDEARSGKFAGSVLLTVAGNTVLDKGYGVANRATGALIVPDTTFQLASVSKQFTAASILLLQEARKLSVNDSIREWIGDSPETWQSISIHHLLTHTSGLPHWRDIPGLDLFSAVSWDRILFAFSAPPPKFPPGTDWAYSSPGYHLLARIVEQVSGERFPDFVRRNIFEPLGMTGTAAGNHPPRGSERALGYAAPLPVAPFELETANRGAGDVWSTTRDLARWNQAVSTPGRILRRESLEAMFTGHAAIPPSEARRFPAIVNPSYGYGWYLGEAQSMPVRFHTGDNPGYRSVNVQIPRVGAILCVLSNEEATDLSRITLRLFGGFTATLGSGNDFGPLSKSG